MLLESGQTFARYRIEELLGRGGAAEVYGAFDSLLKRKVALKLLWPGEGRDSAARTLREARSAAALSHPNAVAIFDVGEIDGTPFIAMELVVGETLRTKARGPGLSIGTKVRWLVEVADVLAHAHESGLVHRDVKPENIMVSQNGAIKVLDFGIAKRGMAHAPPSSGRIVRAAGLDDGSQGQGPASWRTAEGKIQGTPRYMSPEQVYGEPVDGRSDQYAWGLVAYELLSGRHPGAGGAEGSFPHFTKPPVLLSQVVPGVPFEVAAAVMKALEVKPQRRHPTMHEVATAVRPFVSTSDEGGPSVPVPANADAATTKWSRPRPRPSRVGRTAGLSGLAVALLAGALWLVRASSLPTSAFPSSSSTPSTIGPTAGAPQPVVVVVPGSQNLTSEPLFDGTLELMLESDLVRSPSLYPYVGSRMLSLVNELAPGSGGNDEEMGRLLAERMQAHVVVARPAVAPDGPAYRLSIALRDAPSGAILGEFTERAPSIDRVAEAMARLTCQLRRKLGDVACSPGSDERGGGHSSSMEALHLYSLGNRDFAAGRQKEAAEVIAKAVAVDPRYCMAHVTHALVLANLSRSREAQQEAEIAIGMLDGLAPRETLIARAAYYSLMDEFDQAAEIYTSFLARWPFDTHVRDNLAVDYWWTGQVGRALEINLQGIREHPKLLFPRSNRPSLLLAAGRVEESYAETRAVLAEFPHPLEATYLIAAVTQLLLGQRADALATIETLRAKNASLADIATADMAMFEGRVEDATEVLEVAVGEDEYAQVKRVMLAEAYARSGDVAHALDAARIAARSDDIQVLLLAARVLARLGADAEAARVGESIAARPGIRAPRFARIVAANVRSAQHATREAVAQAMGEPGTAPGSWLARADLGQAYFALGAFDEAERELGQAVAMAGPGAMLFFDDLPTLRYAPEARYWLARAKDALHRPDARDAYRALTAIEPDARHDPLVADARKRLVQR